MYEYYTALSCWPVVPVVVVLWGPVAVGIALVIE